MVTAIRQHVYLFFIVSSKGHSLCHSRSLFRLLCPIVLNPFFLSFLLFSFRLHVRPCSCFDTRVCVVFIIIFLFVLSYSLSLRLVFSFVFFPVRTLVILSIPCVTLLLLEIHTVEVL
jgi:hypothetical protein